MARGRFQSGLFEKSLRWMFALLDHSSAMPVGVTCKSHLEFETKPGKDIESQNFSCCANKSWMRRNH